SDIIPKELKSFLRVLPTTPAKDATIVSTSAAIGTWQGHLVLDHETVLRRGLAAMLEEIKARRAAVQGADIDKTNFLRSAEIAIEGVIVFANKIVEKLEAAAAGTTDPERKAVLSKMLDTCRRAPLYPAESFAEAVQSYWTVKTAVELAIPFNVHAPGRLDQMLFPYYEKDKAAGNITQEEALELLDELFLKIMSHNMRPTSSFTGEFNQRYEGSEPVTVGGLTRDGRDAANELTYLIIDSARSSRASLNFVVRLHPGSPEKLFLKIADIYYNGVSSISIMNDAVGVEAMKKRGFSEEDARDYAITGCVDMVAPGRTGGEAFSSLLLCRILDITLRNGDSKTPIGTIKNTGLKTGEPESFRTFDELINAFSRQASFAMEKLAEATRVRDRLYERLLPAPYISAFMQGCVEKGKDVTSGGAEYDFEGVLVMNSIANTVDSLYVIKKLIYERKLFTFRELLLAVDNNFKGFEHIRRAVLSVEGKWGNGNAESDEIARRITDGIFKETYKHRTHKGGFFAPFINSMTAHTIDGRVSIATPDGRCAGRPFAASCNPYNVERNGPTGVLRSVAAIDFSHVLGCAVNIRFHKSAIGETELTRKKWISLVKTYFELGGEQLQPTVVSPEILIAARKDPENYRDVIVKVGGYSAYFTELGSEIQNEIIDRSVHSSR
ncbi:MAG TPA: pyruvate formate lyase family protein, partial [bacterium]|nr:pyruvate formate lyase family protein [bacterium]